MIPFDRVACLAMLLAFYPQASPAALALAFAERPEYFAGGRLTGSKGDKLVLLDGACWDMIFASGTGDPSQMRWLVEPCGGAGDTPADPFPLGPGPFTPIDARRFQRPAFSPVFEPLVQQALASIADVAPALDRTRVAITTGTPIDDVDRAGGAIVDADVARVNQHQALVAVNPFDELVAAASQGNQTYVEENVYYEPTPPDIELPTLPPPDDGGPDYPELPPSP